jgi:MFS family permease
LAKSANDTASIELDTSNDLVESSEEKVTFCGLLWKHPIFTMSALAGTTVQFIYSFMEPILAKRLEEMELDQVQIGWFFMILPASYIPSAIALDYLPKRWDKRLVIIIGMVCCGLSLFCVGPSTFVSEDSPTLWLMVTGQVLLGLFIPVGLILALPSMCESVSAHYPNQVSRVNNLSSGVFNTANGLGEVIGPMFGAAMYEEYGFRMTSDVTALITFFYVLAFVFILTNGMDSIRETITQRAISSRTKEELKVDDKLGD